MIAAARVSTTGKPSVPLESRSYMALILVTFGIISRW